jgi:hypothetical protein
MEPNKTLDDYGLGTFRPSGHATESTVLDIFLKELGNKIKVLTQMSYPQLSGRKQPDATLGEKQDYFIEAKWEGDETKGLVQAARYQRLGGKGIFVVLFSKRLRRSMPQKTLIRQAFNSKIEVIAIFNDKRSQDFFYGKLSEVITKISKHVLKEIPIFEVKTGRVISILQDAVDYISATLAGITEESLDDIFGGKSVFENILQFEEKRYPLKEMRKGAAYLLLNQILFYHLLSKARPNDFQEMDEQNSKILALWFNSTMNISQIISKRAETEGAFMGLSKYILQNFLVLDPTKLNKEQKERLVRMFDRVAKTKLPSIHEQLKTKNKIRRAIDLTILDVLNIKVDKEGTLDLAYKNLAEKIEKLANLMNEGELN